MTVCSQCGFPVRGTVEDDPNNFIPFNQLGPLTLESPLPKTVQTNLVISPDNPNTQPMSSPDFRAISTSPPLYPQLPSSVGPSAVAEAMPNLEKSEDLRTSNSSSFATQLQVRTAQILHIQTNTVIEVPPQLMIIHIGKPNKDVLPDIDVSGFPHSSVVSRKHADIRREGDTYYIEDMGSSNGTYVNSLPLPVGNRHRLRPGDRISLGKGDLITFLFRYSQY
jgi:hypothetical protein